MTLLHKELQKVLQVFFDNFHSDFRGQKFTSKLQIVDVENNTEILQFNIAALYKLQPAWIIKYCVHL